MVTPEEVEKQVRVDRIEQRLLDLERRVETLGNSKEERWVELIERIDKLEREKGHLEQSLEQLHESASSGFGHISERIDWMQKQVTDKLEHLAKHQEERTVLLERVLKQRWVWWLPFWRRT